MIKKPIRETWIIFFIPYFTTKIPFNKIAPPEAVASPANIYGKASFKPYCFVLLHQHTKL